MKKSFELLLAETLSDEHAGELADEFEVLIAVMKTLATPAGEYYIADGSRR